MKLCGYTFYHRVKGVKHRGSQRKNWISDKILFTRLTFFIPINKFAKSVMEMEMNELTEKILKCAYKVHTELGPGLLESAYEECLYFELTQSGFVVAKQKALPLIYHEIKLDAGYRVDLLVENRIVVEVKAVDALNDIHTAQVLTYLKLSGCKVGLLLNFNVTSLRNGIKRLMN